MGSHGKDSRNLLLKQHSSSNPTINVIWCLRHAVAIREDSIYGYPTIIFLGFNQRNHSYVAMLTSNRSSGSRSLRRLKTLRCLPVNQQCWCIQAQAQHHNSTPTASHRLLKPLRTRTPGSRITIQRSNRHGSNRVGNNHSSSIQTPHIISLGAMLAHSLGNL